jgi:hypothetical protein
MKRFLIRLLVTITFILIIVDYTSAQPGDPGGDPDAVPITGIELLIGAGAAFGARKLFVTRNRNK